MSLIPVLSGPLHRNVSAMASLLCQTFRKLHEGQVRLRRSDTILGLDPRYAPAELSQSFNMLKRFAPDSLDAEHSTMFDGDESSGLGGWGDPNDDLQITTGGFKNVVRAYPSPHRIRRNYTSRTPANAPSLFPNDPLAPPVDPTILINGSFSQANYDFLLNGFLGDFMGFQAYLEGIQVGDFLLAIPSYFRCSDQEP